MPSKPIHIELTGGRGFRQSVWDTIRGQLRDRDFSVRDIHVGQPEEGRTREYVNALARAGFLSTQAGQRKGLGRTYRLVRDAGAEAPRVRADGSVVTDGLGQEAMWRTMRMLRGADFSARELAAQASTPAVPIAIVAARYYLFALRDAGYLTVSRPARQTVRGGLPERYRLTRDTGPRPPMVQRTDAVYDPNLGAQVWQRPIDDESAIYGAE